MLNRSVDTNQSMILTSHPETGQEVSLYQGIYAALSEDPHNPLSVVSIANSSLSIDMIQGCSFGCAYCHAQSSIHNLDPEGRHIRRPKRVGFTEEEVLDAVVRHPLFVSGKTVISIGTATTEPFGSHIAIESTHKIMQYLSDKKLDNPVWIVTKAGIPDSSLPIISKYTESGGRVVIALTCSGISSRVEPKQNDRFRNGKEARECGAKVLFYLRPIVETWGCNQERIKQVFQEAHDVVGQNFAAIVPGGLRWTEGIEYGLQNHNLEWPERLLKDEHQKEISPELYEYIIQLAKEYFPETPVYLKSSCGLAAAIGGSVVSGSAYGSSDCHESLCPTHQRDVCKRTRTLLDNPELCPVISTEIQYRIRRAMEVGYEFGPYQIKTIYNTLPYQLLGQN